MSIDLSADGIDWDPYGTWDPSLATDEPDGRPDIAIIPLIEHLRDKGVVTLQSCAGHVGRSDGVLWIAASTVSERSIRKITGAVFSRVYRMIHPWQQWEIGWLPEDFDEAEAVLRELRPRVAAFEQGGVVTGVQMHIEPSPQRQMIPVPVPYCPRCGGGASAMRI